MDVLWYVCHKTELSCSGSHADAGGSDSCVTLPYRDYPTRVRNPVSSDSPAGRTTCLKNGKTGCKSKQGPHHFHPHLLLFIYLCLIIFKGWFVSLLSTDKDTAKLGGFTRFDRYEVKFCMETYADPASRRQAAFAFASLSVKVDMQVFYKTFRQAVIETSGLISFSIHQLPHKQ
jgi:hypothetical protein